MDKFNRGCKLHSPLQASTPSSTRGSDEDVNKTERPRIGVRQPSPPSSTSFDDLDMISKLQLIRDLEEDTREALKDINAIHESEYKLEIGNEKQSLIETAKITTDDFDTSFVF